MPALIHPLILHGLPQLGWAGGTLLIPFSSRLSLPHHRPPTNFSFFHYQLTKLYLIGHAFMLWVTLLRLAEKLVIQIQRIRFDLKPPPTPILGGLHITIPSCTAHSPIFLPPWENFPRQAFITISSDIQVLHGWMASLL